MPNCAFPTHLDEKEERIAAFKDDQRFWFLRWKQLVKPMFAFSYRCPPGIAFGLIPPFIFSLKWRQFPVVLFAKRGKGIYRYENTDGSQKIQDPELNPRMGYYLSRAQKWCRWSIQIQWPLFIALHYYKRPEFVIAPGSDGQRDGMLWYFYAGCKRDGDGIFWMPALHLGHGWK